jgi:hypothetical protein
LWTLVPNEGQTYLSYNYIIRHDNMVKYPTLHTHCFQLETPPLNESASTGKMVCRHNP